MANNKKRNKELENTEFGVDSRYSSIKARNEDGKALMEARLKRLNNVSDDEIIKAKLVQLKLKMEDYVQKPSYQNNDIFTNFLSKYIETIYNKEYNFAHDINITPVKLSQVLNKHRNPGEEFMMRLMLHSEKTYKNICPFKKKLWYEVFYHEKICNTMSRQNEWIPEVEKHVKISKQINEK